MCHNVLIPQYHIILTNDVNSYVSYHSGQSYVLQLSVVCFNESLANDLQRYHYVMTLLVENY